MRSQRLQLLIIEQHDEAILHLTDQMGCSRDASPEKQRSVWYRHACATGSTRDPLTTSGHHLMHQPGDINCDGRRWAADHADGLVVFTISNSERTSPRQVCLGLSIQSC